MDTTKVIVAAMNWGLGHASRCIPIIKLLISQNFTPVIASDGAALKLLQKEFSELEFIALPSYEISYKKNLKRGLLLQVPKILKAIKAEHQVIDNYLSTNKVVGIISDNRFGVRNKKVPSVYITHQLTVLSGLTSVLTTNMHQKLIKKFDECWVPDILDKPRLSGKLSELNFKEPLIRYIGAHSRLTKKDLKTTFDLLILLSGPEPYRTDFETNLLIQLETFKKKKVLLVRGLLNEQKPIQIPENVTLVNYMLSEELEEVMNQSEVILARSGYSTILDLYALEKKAFFVPTPGQSEQEYLAKRMEDLKIAPFKTQKEFKLEMVASVKSYMGFKKMKDEDLNVELFDLFKSE